MVNVLLQDDSIRVKVPVGTKMRDVALKTGASMAFGCRMGECTICAVNILSGGSLLSKKSLKEEKTLEVIHQNKGDARLMCQSSVEAQEGEIVVSYSL